MIGLLAHFGHDVGGRSWWGFWGAFLPMLLIAALVGIAVWALVRNTRGRPAVVTPEAAPPRAESALEEVRFRYARGEIRRDEFLRLSRDLGGEGAGLESDEGAADTD